MGLKTSESHEFLHSSSETEDGTRHLLGEQDLPGTKNIKEIANPSVLIRILISIGIMKSILQNTCPKRVISDEMKHGKHGRLTTCDQLHDSTIEESLMTKEGW